ncbi:EF-hand domain-containing protein [Pseudoalteromonas xiamenensis]
MNNRVKSILLLSGMTILGASNVALAESTFSQYDADGNGAISLGESKVNPALMAQFKDLDADNSGDLSESEFANFKG